MPGPTLRAKEGDRLRIVFRNFGSHPHSMHFHGIHSARMDGVPGAGLIGPGEEFVYEFDATPFGCHHHCHALPLKRHLHKGMYGAFIIDPDPALHPEFDASARSRLLGTPENAQWQEMVMVMNAFDTNFDNENEFYAVNSIPNAYGNRPIRIEKSRPVRIYLVNVTEFDPINSFHLHANFFDYYDTGTQLTPTLKTVDLIMQCQAQRGILGSAMPGTSLACTCSTLTSPSSPSLAGWACSMWRRPEMSDTAVPAPRHSAWRLIACIALPGPCACRGDRLDRCG